MSKTSVIVGKNGVGIVEVNFRDEFIIATMYFHYGIYGLVKRYLDYQLNPFFCLSLKINKKGCFTLQSGNSFGKLKKPQEKIF